MNAEILTVGAEILAGDILDTNARDLARALKGLGVVVSRHASVPDHVERIAEAVREAASRAEVVVVTGGLGPTPDDVTREGVARAFGLGQSVREELVEPLRARYRSHGFREMPEVNLVQLNLPEGSEPIPNPVGTAPGFLLEREGTALFAVPGVPREMQMMLEETIIPWLRAHRPLRALLTRTLKTQGIGESELVTRYGAIFDSLEGVDLAFYPQQPGVNLKLTVLADDPERARARLKAAEGVLRERLEDYVYGTDADTLPGVVLELLRARGWRAGTAESCTGGAVAAYLISVPGASDVMDRGVVAYSNRAKTELLGVPEALIAGHGAVSEPVARAMAEGLRERSGVEVAVATTGIAGPAGGTAEKPVGLVHGAVATPGGTKTFRSVYPGTRDMVIHRSVVNVVNRLRLVLIGAR